jgi:hypothetical protein
MPSILLRSSTLLAQGLFDAAPRAPEPLLLVSLSMSVDVLDARPPPPPGMFSADFGGGSGGTGGRSVRSNPSERSPASGDPTVALLPQVLPGEGGSTFSDRVDEAEVTRPNPIGASVGDLGDEAVLPA